MSKNINTQTISQFAEGVQIITLKAHGLTANIMTFGASLQSLFFEPHPKSLVLGFDKFENYLRYPNYFGANVGRFANRIDLGRAEIEGQNYQLSQNEKDTHMLHGGIDGTGVRNWKIIEHSKSHAILEDSLPDGHMGFPGKLDVSLTYRIVEGAVLELKFSAKTNKATLCNFAHHSYFNLDGSNDILDHQLQINAGAYLPVNSDNIPTGKIATVKSTPFDFTALRSVAWNGAAFNYDHNFCIIKESDGLKPIATLKSSKSNIQLQIDSTEIGLQVYDGAGLGCLKTEGDNVFSPHSGIALEPQAWPDNPNHDTFETSLLRPCDSYHQETRFSFTHMAEKG